MNVNTKGSNNKYLFVRQASQDRIKIINRNKKKLSFLFIHTVLK